jgi:hypothetical protein
VSQYVGGIGPADPKLMIIRGLSTSEVLDRLYKYRLVLPNGCWDWLAKKDFGYARIKIGGHSYRVIRLICAFYHNLNLSNKKQLALHKLPCSFEACWNPEHLYVGTHKDNQADRSRTITHCKRGHDLSLNGYKHWNKKTKSFMRGCRMCKNEAQKRYYKRNNA